MKKAQWTDLFREIRKSKGRYLSLLFIVALGTAFYAGVRSAEPDMTASVDRYYDETSFMDVWVMGTLGLTADDVQAIADTEGITRAEGAYSTELFAVCEDDQPIMNVMSACSSMNDMTIEEGRMPETEEECFMDSLFMMEQGYQVGDTVTLADEDGESPEDLVTDTYTIVGSGTWSWYLSWDRGSASIGDGSVDAFMILSPEAFDMDCYTVIYALVDGVSDLDAFSDEYDDAVGLVTDRIKEISGERCDIRYAEVIGEAKEELADARKEVEDAEQELADAKQKLTDGETEYEDGQSQYADGLKEYEDGKTQYEDGLKQYEDGQKQYADGQKEYEDGWQQYADGLKQYEDGQKELADAQKKLDDSRKELDDGWEEYQSGAAALEAAKAEISSGQSQLKEGEQQIAAAKQELEAGQSELDSQKSVLDEKADQVAQGLKACEEGEAQIAAAQSQLEAKEQELEAGQAAYEEGLAEYEAGASQLDQAAAQLESGRQQLEAAQTQLDDLYGQLEQVKAVYGEESEEYQQLYIQWSQGNVQLQEQREALAERQAQYDASAAELASSKETLDQTAAQLESGRQQILDGKKDLEIQKKELAENKSQLSDAQAQIQEGYAEISAAQSEIDSGKKTLEENEYQLEKNRRELEDGQAQASDSQKQLAGALTQLEEGEIAYRDGDSQLKDAQNELKDAKKELIDAKKELDDAEAELDDAKKELEDAWTELTDARTELDDAEKELTDAKKELADARTELDDGWKEYQEAVEEAEPKLADARGRIADGEKTLAELEQPEWYVLDRDSVQTSVEYGMDAERIGAIGKVFPAIFFLVAALVSLTTMTRMIEEERTLIGTMKALGYGKLSIAGKYILYALSATLAGGIFGVIFGSKVLPYVIMTAYGMLYSNTGFMLMPLHLGLCLFSIGIAVFCTVGAAFAACYKELLSTPAALMRPPAPKQGKRVLLEHIPFIWKHLNFSMKSTIRNLVRYKKRFFMTIFGIGGCMSLLLVSYGLHDSIKEIVDNQYKSIWTYSVSCNIDSKASLEEKKELIQKITEEQPDLESGMLAHQISLDVWTEKVEKTVYLYVVEDTEAMKSYLDLHDRITEEKYELNNDGVILTEKIASTLGVEAGDCITLKLDDTTRKEVAVTAVAENYMYHYIYLTSDLYEQLYGEEPEYNELYLKCSGGMDAAGENALAEYLLQQDLVTSVSLVTELQATVDNMLNSLNLVVWVLIISAGLLVFVVLFNLNNINISERRRELASLKVLGFYDMEVAMYVYRENVFLTIFGVMAGIFMGAALHQYLILTLEVDMIMFGRDIRLPSYLYSILFTIGFAVIVNFGMFYKLKQIDMVESLKSVE